RRALLTGTNLQCTVMCLNSGEDIGKEQHNKADQLLYVESGQCRCTFWQSNCRSTKCAEAGDCIFVPAGVEHNLCSTGNTPLKLFSIYSPPEHAPSTCQTCNPN
ncbi:MAG TPA: cupin domain-containing protein, partial [Ruminococcaceae bacterium]|nr:cupin domain-containing protein [Oscillospiraceae bacterium]